MCLLEICNSQILCYIIAFKFGNNFTAGSKREYHVDPSSELYGARGRT